jgi:hypothetical protein
MQIWRAAETQYCKRCITYILDFMKRSGRNVNSISTADIKFLISHEHHAVSLGDMIDFITLEMPVQQGFTTNGNICLCKALFYIREDIRVHQLTYSRTVFCSVRLNLFVFSFFDLQGNYISTALKDLTLQLCLHPRTVL